MLDVTELTRWAIIRLTAQKNLCKKKKKKKCKQPLTLLLQGSIKEEQNYIRHPYGKTIITSQAIKHDFSR